MLAISRAALMAGVLAVAGPSWADPVLSGHDRHLIERALGAEALGSTLPPPVIGDPRDYVPLSTTNRHYKMLLGPHAGTDATHRTAALDAARWRYELSNDETGFLQMDPDGGLVMSGIEDVQTKALTRYSPEEPFMPRDFRPGAEKNVQMGVKVFDLDNPSELQHEGSLKVTLAHVGAYRIHVPAGYYDTVLLKASFHGQIGPAHVDDEQYRFFARGVGLVAMVERRDVSAYVIYRDRLDVAKVLLSPSS